MYVAYMAVYGSPMLGTDSEGACDGCRVRMLRSDPDSLSPTGVFSNHSDRPPDYVLDVVYVFEECDNE